MKKKYGFMLAVAVLLAGCGQKKETSVITARPVKTTIVESRSIIRKDFSGIVEAVEYVKLAFQVSESKEGTIDCSYRPQGHRPAICRYQIGV